jgi:hypothetical protein
MDLLTQGLGLLRGERDGQVRRALADARRTAHRPRAEPLERGTLVGDHGVDPQVLADELVVVLRVGDGGLEQLAPVAGDAARGVKARMARASSTDLPRMWSQTSRALRAEVRTYLAWAETFSPTGAAGWRESCA